MSFQPYPQQRVIMAHFADPKSGSLIVEACAGSGKCLGLGTPVLRFDGSVVPVEQINVGDDLMGPDSRPRRVLSTNVGHGPLFLIEPRKGEPWVCNDVHVMTLAGTNRVNGQVRDVPLNALLREAEEKHRRHDRDWKLWRVGVDFKEQPLPLDPYFVGLWLGDGTTGEPTLTNCEPEILAFCQEFAGRHCLRLQVTQDDRNNTNTLRFCVGGKTEFKASWLRHLLRESFTDVYKVLPREYLINSRANRLQLLAGLLDTDGYLMGGCYEVTTKDLRLAQSYLFLARSLGFAAYLREKISTIRALDFSGLYYRISISGNILEEIPCRVARRRALRRQQIKRVDVTGFSATPIGDGDYYGFTLDGDGRFLLGDFTVTHNTTTVLESVLAPENRDQTTLICAFNTRIKEDMEAKLSARQIPTGRWIEVRTLHSLGLKLIGSHWYGVQRDKKAGDELVRRHFTGHPRARYHVTRLVTHCKDVRPHLHTDPNAVAEATKIVMQEINDLKILDQPALVHQMAQAVVDVMIASLQRRDTIDFADMIWVPVACNLAPKGRFKRVVVDEGQDLSLSQFELLERFVAPGGGLVMVGDISQAIYAWRGADANEIWRRMREKWNAKTLPLTVSFRCAQAIVATAKDLVPAIESKPGADVGIVDEIDGEELLDHVRPGDFVLSRANAPLVVLAVECWLRGGVNPVIEGARELAEPVLHILDKLSISSIESYRASLDRWYNEQVARSTSDANASWTDRVDDWYSLLKAVGERVGPSRVRSVLQSIFSIKSAKANNDDFSLDVDGPKYLSFSTVHKAKGLEADRVFLLKQSFERYQDRDREPPQEELNIEYVAITRAKTHLTWVNIDWAGPRSRGASLADRRKAPKTKPKPTPETRDLPDDGWMPQDEDCSICLRHYADCICPPLTARITDVDTGVAVEGPFDQAVEAVLGAALDDVVMKHHGEIPDDDPRFLPMSVPTVAVIIPTSSKPKRIFPPAVKRKR